MNTPEVIAAIVAVASVSLTHVIADYRVKIRAVDRLRLVNPPALPKVTGKTDEDAKVPPAATPGDPDTEPIATVRAA